MCCMQVMEGLPHMHALACRAGEAMHSAPRAGIHGDAYYCFGDVYLPPTSGGFQGEAVEQLALYWLLFAGAL
jgi:hypothetical protein